MYKNEGDGHTATTRRSMLKRAGQQPPCSPCRFVAHLQHASVTVAQQTPAAPGHTCPSPSHSMQQRQNPLAGRRGGGRAGGHGGAGLAAGAGGGRGGAHPGQGGCHYGAGAAVGVGASTCCTVQGLAVQSRETGSLGREQGSPLLGSSLVSAACHLSCFQRDVLRWHNCRCLVSAEDGRLLSPPPCRRCAASWRRSRSSRRTTAS